MFKKPQANISSGGVLGGEIVASPQKYEITANQKQLERRNWFLLAGLAAVAIIVVLISLASGAAGMSLVDSAKALFGFGEPCRLNSFRLRTMPILSYYI